MTNFYKHLLRQRLYESIDSELVFDGGIPFADTPSGDDNIPRRIYLLPPRTRADSVKVDPTSGTSTATTSSSMESFTDTKSRISSDAGDADNADILVYAPVSLDSLTEEEARDLATHGTWVASPQSTSFPASHYSDASQSTHRRRSTSQSSSRKSLRGHRHSRAHSSSENWHTLNSVPNSRTAEPVMTKSAVESRGRSNSFGKHGAIQLPTLPDEGLLPTYAEAATVVCGHSSHVKT